MKDQIAAIISATGFLSRLPIWPIAQRFHLADDDNPVGFHESAMFFPIAGLIIAVPACAVFSILNFWSVPTIITALLIIGCSIVVTGALHEDGLTDVADGFGGGSNIERKLEIMRDSAIGTYGACALIIVLAIKVAALFLILNISSLFSVIALLLIASATSRAAMLYPWSQLDPARTEGGLSSKLGTPSSSSLQVAAIITAILWLFLMLPSLGLVGTALTFGITAALTMAATSLYDRQIGGHTGDTLGATQQIVECGILICAASYLQA